MDKSTAAWDPQCKKSSTKSTSENARSVERCGNPIYTGDLSIFLLRMPKSCLRSQHVNSAKYTVISIVEIVRLAECRAAQIQDLVPLKEEIHVLEPHFGGG